MRQVRHPLVEQDVIGIFQHVLSATGGDLEAAELRLNEIDELLAAIAANPASGMRLSPTLPGWLVRHGGRRHRITVVFRPDLEQRLLYIALVAFGGQNWLEAVEGRASFSQDGRSRP
jgi:hypothetical protein